MELATLFIMTSLSLGLPQGLLGSVCLVESNHQPLAVAPHDGGSASVGVCMVKKSTAAMFGFKGTEKDLLKPEVNIYYAGLYLKSQIERYHSIVRGVCAYNRGKSTGDGWNRYTRKVWHEWNRAGHKERCSYPRGRSKNGR